MIFCTPKAIYSDSTKHLITFAKRLKIPFGLFDICGHFYYTATPLQIKKAIAKGAKPITESELIALGWLIS